MKYYFQKYQGDDGMHFLSVTPELMSLNMPRKRRNAAFVKSISAERIVNASLRNLGFQAEYFSFLGHAQSTVRRGRRRRCRRDAEVLRGGPLATTETQSAQRATAFGPAS